MLWFGMAVVFVIIVLTIGIRGAQAQGGYVYFTAQPCVDGVVITNYQTQNMLVSYRIAQRPNAAGTFYMSPGYAQPIFFNKWEVFEFTVNGIAQPTLITNRDQNCSYPTYYVLPARDHRTAVYNPPVVPAQPAITGESCTKDITGMFDLVPNGDMHFSLGAEPVIYKISGPGQYWPRTQVSDLEGILETSDTQVAGKVDALFDCRHRPINSYYRDPITGRQYAIHQWYLMSVEGHSAVEFALLGNHDKRSLTRNIVIRRILTDKLNLGPYSRATVIN